MTAPAHTYRDFADGFLREDAALVTARARAAQVGLAAVSPGTGAALRLLAASVDARAVAEIGTGAGISGIWLLRGIRPDGILTTIDHEPDHQRLAKRAFAEAEIPAARARLIAGEADQVLPRLADGAYDLIFADADAAEANGYVGAAARLLRRGGVFVLNHAVGGGRIADPAARDPESVAIRAALGLVRDSEEWLPALLPVGAGLLAAVRTDVQ